MSHDEYISYMTKLFGWDNFSRMSPKDEIIPSNFSGTSNSPVKSDFTQHSVATESKQHTTESETKQHTVASKSQNTARKQKTWGYIPEDALRIIRHYEKLFAQSSNNNIKSSYDELIIWSNVWSHNMHYTLEYALDQGTPYKIVNEKIYVWYKHYKGFSGSGYYRLKRFHYNGTNAIFVMAAYDKLPDSFN